MSVWLLVLLVSATLKALRNGGRCKAFKVIAGKVDKTLAPFVGLSGVNPFFGLLPPAIFRISSARLGLGRWAQAGHLSVKPQHVRNHLWIFVNCLIENPAAGRLCIAGV